jgi:hypothetical protein
LVHELVHYRFDYMPHGAKFEQRIREILRGKVFPVKKLFDNNTSQQPSDKNVAPILTPIPTPKPMNFESQYYQLLEKNKKLASELARIKDQVAALFLSLG